MKAIEKFWEHPLWPHYGSREDGTWGAIYCQAHEGNAHEGENHCITEIIDKEGNVLPDGQWGELVITTIGMEAHSWSDTGPAIIHVSSPENVSLRKWGKASGFCKAHRPVKSMREMDELLFPVSETGRLLCKECWREKGNHSTLYQITEELIRNVCTE